MLCLVEKSRRDNLTLEFESHAKKELAFKVIIKIDL